METQIDNNNSGLAQGNPPEYSNLETVSVPLYDQSPTYNRIGIWLINIGVISMIISLFFKNTAAFHHIFHSLNPYLLIASLIGTPLGGCITKLKYGIWGQLALLPLVVIIALDADSAALITFSFIILISIPIMMFVHLIRYLIWKKANGI